MKKYIICTFLDSFDFPLREGLSKQIWWKAKEKQKFYDVSIIIFGNKIDTLEHDGVKIFFVNKRHISSYRIEGDIIDFMTTIVEFRTIFSFFMKGKKILGLYDGYPLGKDKVLLRKIYSKFLPFLFDEIYVLSDFQKKCLNIKNIKKIKPYLPLINKKNYSKYSNPTLLYMGHLSYFKGVDLILDSFIELKKEIKNLNLIIANNMIAGDKSLILRVKELKDKYPDSIIIKGVIDPIEELSKCWIYLYPFKEPGGTMAFALSIYESIQCNTPFIACNIGSNKEFFGEDNLINCKKEEMIYKIKQILKNTYHIE